MADESRINEAAPGTVETTDRGMFDFLKKKEDVAKASDHDTITSGVEKVHLSQPEGRKDEDEYEEEAKHGSLLDKFHRDDHKSSSSSSSDEEGDDEEKKRRKKERKEKKKAGLKEKFDEKFGHKKEEQHDDHHHHDDNTNVPIEKIHVQENVYNEQYYAPPATVVHHDQQHQQEVTHHHDQHDQHHQEEEKKQGGGFMDKIKDKLPGGHKDKTGEAAEAATPVAVEPCVEEEKEKKGFLDKIKEKIPGFHSKTDAEEKKEHDEKKESH